MPRDSITRKVERIVNILAAMSHKARMTAIVHILQQPEGIRAGKAFPSDLPPTRRPDHVKKMKSLISVERPSKKEDAVYSLPLRIRKPLQEAVEALDRLALTANKRSSQHPHITISVNNEGLFVVNGVAADDEHLPDAVRDALGLTNEVED